MTIELLKWLGLLVIIGWGVWMWIWVIPWAERKTAEFLNRKLLKED